MASWALAAAGFIGAFYGCAVLEDGRQRRCQSYPSLLWSLLAGYLVFRNSDALTDGGIDQLAVFAITFAAISPVLSFLLYGPGRHLVIITLKTAFFFSSLLICALTWNVLLLEVFSYTSWPVAAVLGLLTVCLILTLWKRPWRRKRRPKPSPQPKADRKMEKEVERLTKRLQTVEDQRTERQHHRNAQRAEILDQVRKLRLADAQRIMDGGYPLFHQSLGFLTAEAWRVVRSEVRSGERFAESDAAFFEVVNELLQDDGFEERYFHNAGRQAIVAVNCYLRAEIPLSAAVTTVAGLEIKPSQLAPTLLEGDMITGLIEEWIAPHRQRQETEREIYVAGLHHRGDEIATHLLEQGVSGDPQANVWQRFWDERPEIFQGEPTGGHDEQHNLAGRLRLLVRPQE